MRENKVNIYEDLAESNVCKSNIYFIKNYINDL
jgi:hypothetical protein